MKTKSNHHRAGFTMMEMVLVLAIIALLMGVAIKGMGVFLDKGKETRARGDIEALSSLLILYQSDNLFLPTTEQGLRALTVKPTTAPVPKRWRKYSPKELLDPWGSTYEFRNPATRNVDGDYDLFSSGPDKVPGNEDDIGNWDTI
jgi:general secretion pathway protein G